MPDRRVAPPLQHTLRFELPKPEYFLEKEGLTGLLVASEDQPVVRIEAIFPAGKIAEPGEAISHFTALMLEKGTKNHSAKEIATTLDYYSAHLEVSPGMDFTTVGLYCLSRNLKNVLPLFIEILSQPSFDEGEFRLASSIFLQNLQVNLEKNAYLASQSIRQLVFGKHPYGQTVTEADVHALTPQHLQDFFQKFYKPICVMIAGSIQAEDLRILCDGLSTGMVTSPNFQSPTHQRGEKRIEKPDSVQSSIRMGKNGLNRLDNDFPAFLLTNHLLGGYFGSRLMKNIREEKGLTYGIYSSLQHMNKATFHTIGADVNKENLEAALVAIRQELEKLNQVEQAEIGIARNHLIGSMQNDVSTIFAVADKIKTIQLNQLPEEYYQQLILHLDRLTIQDIKNAAEKYFQPQDFSLAIAG